LCRRPRIGRSAADAAGGIDRDASDDAFLLILLVPLTWWLVERSRWGLELRAVGENPQAADVTGIKVNLRRRQALLWCGALAGLGGAYLAVGEVGSFNQNMTAGRGYLVIAAVIFGAWRLGRTLLGCLVFGLSDAMRLALPALGVTLNAQLLVAAPYLLALLAMVLFTTQHREPRRSAGLSSAGRPDGRAGAPPATGCRPTYVQYVGLYRHARTRVGHRARIEDDSGDRDGGRGIRRGDPSAAVAGCLLHGTSDPEP
jgi:hypothetical protein